MTPLIQEVWPQVAALDLSPGMLARARSGARIRGDASRLPLADGGAAVLAEALAAASGHPWRAVQSEAYWGTWAVLRPA
jgi:hypothetical protein